MQIDCADVFRLYGFLLNIGRRIDGNFCVAIILGSLEEQAINLSCGINNHVLSDVSFIKLTGNNVDTMGSFKVL